MPSGQPGVCPHAQVGLLTMHLIPSRHRSEHLTVFVVVALEILISGCPAAAHEPLIPWQQPTGWPDRIITTLGSDPCRSFSVTWRTDSSVENTVGQITKAVADARFDLSVPELAARTEEFRLDPVTTPHGHAMRTYNKGLGSVHYHSITFTDLEPNTKYAWRVQGTRGKWSEWFQTRTLPENGPISFVYFGDAQNGIRSHWSRVIREAHAVAGDASFYLHAGDLVNKGDNDLDWAEWFNAGSYLHARIPTLPVVGNHEYIPVIHSATGKKKRLLTPLWRAQFTLPVVQELPKELHEAVYEFRCGKDLHIFALNSAPSDYKVQASWLDQKLSSTDATWRIVTMHHPYFIPMHSNKLADNAARISAFTDVINQHEVDMVIVGHIHTYARSTSPRLISDQPARHASGNPQDVKTVFVISSSGAKVNQLQDATWVKEHVGDGRVEPGLPNLSIDRMAGNTPMFQVILINGNQLEFKAYTAIGNVYDHFSLVKNAGRKLLTNGSETYGEPRLFENTGPYSDSDIPR